MTTTALRTIATKPPESKQSKTPLLDEAKRKIANLPKAKRTGNVDFDTETSSIWLDGEIDDSTVIAVRNGLKQMRSRVTLYINSPGGYVASGVGLYTELSQLPLGLTTVCTGLCASIASVVFQAGEKRLMASGSLMMIHQPWSVTSGNSQELQKQIEILDRFQEAMLEIYSRRTGKTAAVITKLLQSETWYTSSEAVAENFADGLFGQDAAEPRMSIAQARQRIAQLDRLPKIDPRPMTTAAKSKNLRLRIQTDKILRSIDED